MSKVDGRKLRQDIKGYIKKEHPGKNPHFTVRSVVKRNRLKRDEHVLEVRFDELDDDLLIWSDVADWVIIKWWPKNKNYATMSKKIWRNKYIKSKSYEVKVDRVEVGYGFTH